MNEIRCPQCGGNKHSDLSNGNKKCLYCGNEFVPVYSTIPPKNTNDPFALGASGKSRGVAGILAILLGGLGIQYFYLGKSTAGVICLCATILTCGILGSIISILSIIQGIMMITMDESTFESKYVYSKETFPIF